MINLDEKCDLCNGWGLISKQNNSCIQCPKCEIKKIDERFDEIQKEIDEIEKPHYADPAPVSFNPVVLDSNGNGANGETIVNIVPTIDELAKPKRGRPKKGV